MDNRTDYLNNNNNNWPSFTINESENAASALPGGIEKGNEVILEINQNTIQLGELPFQYSKRNI